MLKNTKKKKYVYIMSPAKRKRHPRKIVDQRARAEENPEDLEVGHFLLGRLQGAVPQHWRDRQPSGSPCHSEPIGPPAVGMYT